MCSSDFRHCAATGSVGHQTAVADARYFGVEKRPYNEAGAELNVECGGGGIYDRSYTECQFGTFGGGEFYQISEYLVGEIAAVGELKGADASGVACFDYLSGHFEVFVVEHGHHARGSYFGHYGLFVESCHDEVFGFMV